MSLDKAASEQWMRTDAQHDVLVSLREVLNQLQRVEDDVNCWKWALNALANAVNSALTCNLTGTMQVGALETKIAEATIEALQSGSGKKIPKPRLASPHGLLERATDAAPRIEQAGTALKISPAQQKSFRRLFTFRDGFTHFKPTLWYIEVSGFPEIFRDVVQIVKAIIGDGRSFRRDEALQSELRTLCDEITSKLQRLGSF
jgi:hypothetical protein